MADHKCIIHWTLILQTATFILLCEGLAKYQLLTRSGLF